MRNIANVVHDLHPVVKFLNNKLEDLSGTENPDQVIDLLKSIAHDAKMLERYLAALNDEAKEHDIKKA